MEKVQVDRAQPATPFLTKARSQVRPARKAHTCGNNFKTRLSQAKEYTILNANAIQTRTVAIMAGHIIGGENSYEIMETLMRYDVDMSLARHVGLNEFRSWTPGAISAAFDSIKQPYTRYRPFEDAGPFVQQRKALDSQGQPTSLITRRTKHFLPLVTRCSKYWEAVWPSVFSRAKVWFSAPRKLVEDAILQKGALCINENGELAIRTRDYVAISHAWSEGLQFNELHQGVEKAKIDLIFQALSRQCIATSWIWVDVIAVPGPSNAGKTGEEDILKIDVLNTLADVYRNADGIAIFDPLTLQLAKNHPRSLAIVLRCSKWSTRIWTFQEVKLAKRIYILTGGPLNKPAPKWNEMVLGLSDLRSQDPERFTRLHDWYIALQAQDRQVDILDTYRLCTKNNYTDWRDQLACPSQTSSGSVKAARQAMK